ncbi:unnamed protein product, partial [Phaeothamnion confervicola]
MRQTSTAVLSLWLLTGFAYCGILLLIMAVFASSSGDGCSFSYGFLVATSVGEVLGNFGTMAVIESWGRIRTFTVLCMVTAAATMWMASGIGAELVTLACAFAARAAIGGATTVTWVQTPEVFPTEVRATANCMGQAAAFVGAVAASYLVDSSLATLCSGAVLSAAVLASAIIVRSLPETAGRTVDLAMAADDGRLHHLDSVRGTHSGRVASFWADGDSVGGGGDGGGGGGRDGSSDRGGGGGGGSG